MYCTEVEDCNKLYQGKYRVLLVVDNSHPEAPILVIFFDNLLAWPAMVN